MKKQYKVEPFVVLENLVILHFKNVRIYEGGKIFEDLIKVNGVISAKLHNQYAILIQKGDLYDWEEVIKEIDFLLTSKNLEKIQ